MKSKNTKSKAKFKLTKENEYVLFGVWLIILSSISMLVGVFNFIEKAYLMGVIYALISAFGYYLVLRLIKTRNTFYYRKHLIAFFILYIAINVFL